MDRNTAIGLSLIAAIVLVFSFLSQPSEEELKAREAAKAEQEKLVAEAQEAEQAVIEPADGPYQDSIRREELAQKLPADLVSLGMGTEEELVLENELLKLVFTNKGGQLKKIELKQYKTYDSLPLIITEDELSSLSYQLSAQGKQVDSKELFFQAQGEPAKLTAPGQEASISYSINLGEGKRFVQHYSLSSGEYMLGYRTEWIGFAAGQPINANWTSLIKQLEKSRQVEANLSTIHFKEMSSGTDYLSETGDDDEQPEERLKWISFKQQFFARTLIAEDGFEKANLEVKVMDEGHPYLKQTTASFELPIASSNQSHSFRYFLGPCQYKALKQYDLDLEDQIPLGWGIFGWVNKFLIIPVFGFFGQYITNYGIIILIMTVMIKMVLIFFTYKSFLSGAKMRALKPELDALKEKYGSDMQRLQMEQMKVYQQTGVSPFGGCLPQLLQLPILIAMFRFFPASIELRQKSFLWVDDLSTYDSILSLPFEIPFYGDHVSLFPLLMTISTFFYTQMNASFAPQQKEMKYVTYFMPIIFLGFLNSYSAGLSYYYLLSNLISIGQTVLFRRFVDHDKLRAKIEENKKNPGAKKVNRFQQRFQELQQKSLENQQSQQKNKSKKKK